MANVPVQLRRIGTQAAAAASSVVLLDGQAIYVKDSKRLYFGDGTSTLAQLVTAGAYLLPNPEYITRLGADLTALSEALTLSTQTYADAQAQAAYDDARAYTDSAVASAFRPAGGWDADAGSWPTTGSGPGGIVRAGDVYKVTTRGTIDSQEFDIGDSFYAIIDNPGQDEESWARFESNDNQATESYRGTALIATEAEVVNGVDVPSIVTPKNWWSAFSSGFTALGKRLRDLATPAGPRWIRTDSDGTLSQRTAAETRTDLGLGNSATRDVGTGAGTVCAGDDARLSDARTPTSHVHSASDITSGTLDIARGGTGATTAAAAREALGIVTKNAAPAYATTGAGFESVTGATVTLKANTTYHIIITADTRTTGASSAPNLSVSCTNSPTIALFRQQNSSETALGQRTSITANDGGTTYTGSGMATSTPLLCTLVGTITVGVSDSVLTLRLARGGSNNVSLQSYGIMALPG